MNSPSNKTFQFPEVRVVEASAGSGKTYALAKRYLQLLLNPSLEFEFIPIRNILALTFTNKAAFEMKARILEFLKRLALGQMPKAQEDEILDALNVKPEQARAKAFMIMEALIHHYNFFQVQTIDKFINALLSGCAFKIGLTANFKIKTNASDYLQYSLDLMIDRAHLDKGIHKIFDEFLHQYLYLENRSGWFPKEDMMMILSDLFMQHNAYGLDFQECRFTAEDLIKKKKMLLEEIKAFKEILPVETDSRFTQSLEKFLKENIKGFDIDSVSDYFAREIVPVRKGIDVPREVEQLWGVIKRHLREVCEQEAYALFNPYLRVFSGVMEEFATVSSREDVLFLSELNTKAGMLFDDSYVTVEELYYRLATRFHHYLIDEFQDTSRLQWHNIEKMAEEALSTGGSLFYVGDRKQAIYGFRGGEIELFDEIKERFTAFNVQTESLTKNWRSQKAVVEFNNTVFAAENLERFITAKERYEEEKKKRNAIAFSPEDRKEIENLFGAARQSFKPGFDHGYVRMEYVDIEKKEDRDAAIRGRLISLIKDLRQRFAFRDIAILTRGNYEIEQMTHWLLEEGLPVESERTSDVKKHHLISELTAFLRFLHSPIDNLAFASFLLGDIFARAAGLSKEEMHVFIFGLRQRLKNERDMYLYTEFRKVYPSLWDQLIEPFFKNIGLYPLYELAVSLYSRFKVLDHFPTSQGFFMHFLELIKKREEEQTDVGSFLGYFDKLEGEDLFVHVTDSDAIKILTIHKSKGLEFPVVILPFLGMDVQVGAASVDNQQSYILQKSGSFIELVRLKNKYLNFSDTLYRMYAREYKKTFLSELNNIYVALTRPRNELYGFIPKRCGNSFNLARFLIPEASYERGSASVYGPGNEKRDAYWTLPCSSYQDWIGYLKDEFTDYDQLKNRKEKRKGRLIHFMLSLVENCSWDNKEKTLQRIHQEAQRSFPQDDLFNECLAKVERLLETHELRAFFYSDQAQVYTEKEIVDKEGHTRRLDRLIVYPSEVWIVDYKTARDPQFRYAQQLREYRDLVGELYPEKKSRGFLIYVEEMVGEEIGAIRA